MTPKCQRCKVRPAVWAVQNIAGEVSVTTLGSHYRGFPVVKVCDECKDTATRTGTAPE